MSVSCPQLVTRPPFWPFLSMVFWHLFGTCLISVHRTLGGQNHIFLKCHQIENPFFEKISLRRIGWRLFHPNRSLSDHGYELQTIEFELLASFLNFEPSQLTSTDKHLAWTTVHWIVLVELYRMVVLISLCELTGTNYEQKTDGFGFHVTHKKTLSPYRVPPSF